MNTELIRCTPADADTLRDLGIITYYETFGPKNTQENMELYTRTAYDVRRLRKELTDPNSEYYFLYADGCLAGYIKVNETPSQSDINDPDSLEVQRIYVSGRFQGMGLGRYLLNSAIAMARERNKKYLWLGAWEHNEKALRFYKKMGLSPAGTHPFLMGTDWQTDYIMRLDLA